MSELTVALRHASMQVADLREGGLLLRLHVADLNMVINNCMANAELYTDVLSELGFPAGSEALALSTFAVVDGGPLIHDLTSGRRSYLIADPRALEQAGVQILATDTFHESGPDPFNHVHFDVIVAAGRSVVPAGAFSSSKTDRAAARGEIEPAVRRILGLFTGPYPARH